MVESVSDPNAKFKFGWTTSGVHNLDAPKFDQLNEQNVFEGSVGLMDKDHPGEWFINVIPGDYKFSAKLKYLEGNTLATDILKATAIEVILDVNGKEVKGSITKISDILDLSIERFKVTRDEIRIKNPDPNVPVSILSMIIATLQPEGDKGGKKPVEGSKEEAYINCPFSGDVVNCV